MLELIEGNAAMELASPTSVYVIAVSRGQWVTDQGKVQVITVKGSKPGTTTRMLWPTMAQQP